MTTTTTALTTTTTTTTVDDERVVAAAALEMAEEQLQSLTASQAGTFVAVERRNATFQQHLQELLHSIIDICTQQTETAQQCIRTSTSIDELSERHRVRRRTLLQHESLLELLELPHLMDAAVRSNLYEEALQIAAFANTLERRHNSNSNNVVVHNVIAQIRSRQQVDLRSHLLDVLKTPIAIQDCLQVVTALRRLNAIDLEQQTTSSSSNMERTHAAMEYALQLDFLEARDVYLNKTTAAAANEASSSSSLLLDIIERYRTRLFEIVTQFNAIFRSSNNNDNNNSDDDHNNNKLLLTLWTVRRVEAFLQILQDAMNNSSSSNCAVVVMDAAACRDALEASVFFGHSMQRLGVDLTAQLASIFATKMCHIVITEYWNEGVTQFRETLTICREAGVAAPLASTSSVAVGVTDQQDEAELFANRNALGDPQPAPKKLLSLPPLARLVNAVLAGLNELRRCLLPTIFPRLRTALEEILQSIESEIASHQRAVNVPGLLGDEVASLRRIAAEFDTVWREICEPYLRGSLEAAIGNTAAAGLHHRTLWENLKAQQEKEMQNTSTDDEKNSSNDDEPKGQDQGADDDDEKVSGAAEDDAENRNEDDESLGQHEEEDDDDGSLGQHEEEDD